MNFEQQLAEIGCACEQPAAQCHSCGPVLCVRPSALHAAQCHACGPVPCVWPSAMPVAQCQRSWSLRLSAVGPTIARIRRRFCAAHPRTRAPWHASLCSSKASGASKYTACARQAPSSAHAFKGSERLRKEVPGNRRTNGGKKARRTPRRDRTELDAHWPRSSRLRASAGGLGSPAWPTHCGSRQPRAHAAHSCDVVPSDTGRCSGAYWHPCERHISARRNQRPDGANEGLCLMYKHHCG